MLSYSDFKGSLIKSESAAEVMYFGFLGVMSRLESAIRFASLRDDELWRRLASFFGDFVFRTTLYSWDWHLSNMRSSEEIFPFIFRVLSNLLKKPRGEVMCKNGRYREKEAVTLESEILTSCD